MELSNPHVIDGPYLPNHLKDVDARRALLAEIKQDFKVSKLVKAVSDNIVVFDGLHKGSRVIFAYNTKSNDIAYWVKLQPLKPTWSVKAPKGLKGEFLYQSSVWRSSDPDEYLGLGADFAANIFNKLGEKYNMFSDDTQSELGKRFWLRRISQALEAGRRVWALEFDKTRIVSVEEIKLNMTINKYWSHGDDYSGHWWRILIDRK